MNPTEKMRICTMDKKELTVPEQTSAHKVTELIKPVMTAITGSYPPVAPIGAAFNFWRDFIRDTYQGRVNQFLQDLADRLMALEKQHDNFLESLKSDDKFFTTLYHAIRIAVGTHEQERREALVNMVLNSAIHNPPDEDLHLMFLLGFDTMTSWHLHLLKFLGNPKNSCRERQISFPDDVPDHLLHISVEQIFPELQTRHAFYTQIVTDLANRGLVHSHLFSWGPESQLQVWLQKLTTDLGDQFLSFASSPAFQSGRGGEKKK